PRFDGPTLTRSHSTRQRGAGGARVGDQLTTTLRRHAPGDGISIEPPEGQHRGRLRVGDDPLDEIDQH
ncbi:MAG: hypothetical protein DMD89_27995, partial [Candidatus Rokuibacteriota bacterium]